MMPSIVGSTALAALAVLSVACTTTPSGTSPSADYLPRIASTPDLVDELSVDRLESLRLIATNLVSVLVQVPGMDPVARTLQVSAAATPFGNAVIKALEDAGYGLQQVSADQGQHYLTYSRRYSETESGPVTEFEVAVGDVRISRAYVNDGDKVFPSSLLQVDGLDSPVDLLLDDRVFREQGSNGRVFLTGAIGAGVEGQAAEVGEVQVTPAHTVPQDARIAHREVLDKARQHAALGQSMRAAPDPTRFSKLRRTVLIFDDAETRRLGAANKQAVRLLIRDIEDTDRFVITGCTDVDGVNELADERALRVEEEFISHEVQPSALWIAPCRRASYRHAADNSPVPVEVVQYRERLPVQ